MAMSPTTAALVAPVPVRPSLLRQPAFRRLWAAHTVSLAGDQVTLLALPLVAVLRLGASPAQMGLLTAMGWLPHLLFSVPAGTWIDQRRHRRPILVFADLVRAALLVTVPAAAFAGLLTLGQLYAVAFASGCLTVLFDGSGITFFQAVVDPADVADAQSRMSTSRAAAQVAGPGAAGWLVQVLGGPVALVADAASFVVSAVLLRGIRVTEPVVAIDPEPWWRRGREGLRFIAGHRLLRYVGVACGLLNFFDMMLLAVLVLYLTRGLGLEPGIVGTVLAGGALGAVVGAVVAPRVARRIGLGLTNGLGGFGICIAPFTVVLAGGSRPVVVAVLLAGQFVAGVGVMLFDVNQNAVLMLVIPYRLRGRSTGAMRLLAYGPRPLGALAGGLLGAWIGLPATIWVAAIGGVSGALVTWWSPIRRLAVLPRSADADPLAA